MSPEVEDAMAPGIAIVRENTRLSTLSFDDGKTSFFVKQALDTPSLLIKGNLQVCIL
ncbi:MAG: hypothetical protein V3569_02885 [Acholeplasmataceae bacterium]